MPPLEQVSGNTAEQAIEQIEAEPKPPLTEEEKRALDDLYTTHENHENTPQETFRRDELLHQLEHRGPFGEITQSVREVKDKITGSPNEIMGKTYLPPQVSIPLGNVVSALIDRWVGKFGHVIKSADNAVRELEKDQPPARKVDGVMGEVVGGLAGVLDDLTFGALSSIREKAQKYDDGKPKPPYDPQAP